MRTIKLTKNINYLTEKLPKPNYSPLRYKSLLANRSSMNHPHHSSLRKKDSIELKLSLPPINGGVNPRKIVKSDRNLINNKSRKRIINNEESLPKLNIKYRANEKNYLHWIPYDNNWYFLWVFYIIHPLLIINKCIHHHNLFSSIYFVISI